MALEVGSRLGHDDVTALIGEGGTLGRGREFDPAPDGDRFIIRTLETATQTSDDELFHGLIFVQDWFEELKERVSMN